MSTCCFPIHQKSDPKSRTNMKAEQIPPQLTSTLMVLHTLLFFPALARVSYLFRQRLVNQLRWKSVVCACRRQALPVWVFDSDWCTTLLCCFSALAELYKSPYSPVSSLKDSGRIRPGGACVQCSCCQHYCSHSRGQQCSALWLKNGSLHLILWTEVSISFSLTNRCFSFLPTPQAHLDIHSRLHWLWLPLSVIHKAITHTHKVWQTFGTLHKINLLN